MSWQTVFTAMLPEHLLLAGIVALIGLEIAAGKPRAALLLSALTVTAACAEATGTSVATAASATRVLLIRRTLAGSVRRHAR